MPALALDYASIPEYAALLPAKDDASEPQSPAAPRRFSLDALSASLASTSETSPTDEHAKTASSTPSSSIFANLLISSAIKMPAAQSGSSPRGPPHALLSTKEPLSIPTTTSNFRRFVSRIGFFFWVLDRTEEIVMWKKGWKYTASWIVLYCTICYNPWLLMLLPNTAIISVMLSSYHVPQKPLNGRPSTHIADPSLPASAQLPSSGPVVEGSAAWLANIQALQNLMGSISDAYDLAMPLVPLITFKSRATAPLFLLLLFTALPLTLLPLRLVAAIAGLTTFTVTHPTIRHILFDPNGLLQQSRLVLYIREELRRLINDVSLSEEHIASELEEISIYQNERWVSPTSSPISARSGNVVQAGWKNGVGNLKPSERGAWTRGSDGSITAGESNLHLNVELDPGWAFVETEDWEPDLLAGWVACGGDRDGWVYTNDAWLDPRPAPITEWQKSGMTRRRRWARRIYPIAGT